MTTVPVVSCPTCGARLSWLRDEYGAHPLPVEIEPSARGTLVANLEAGTYWRPASLQIVDPSVRYLNHRAICSMARRPTKRQRKNGKKNRKGGKAA